ncbi:MAG: phosphate regulon sensor histidine kinase PhoR [Gammaproteobacteria bacterium]|nr:phosphate regulon sensor histidine kinase PhoR [Gammaproteobacteria bacterium]
MSNPWIIEIRRGLLWLLLAAVAGTVAGRPALALLLTLGALVAWHALHLVRFVTYLQGGGAAPQQEMPGIWGELYYLVHRLRERNRRSKRRLTDLLARFRASTAALPDGIILLDTDNVIEWFNEMAMQLLELDPQSDIGQRIDNLLRHPEFVAYLRGTEYREPLKLRSPVDDRTMLQFHLVPYGERQFLLVVRNITRTYQLEMMRRDFVANVSHELVTPLTVMAGYLESLSVDESVRRAPWRGALDEMLHQTQRMQHIVDDLLLLSRLEMASPHATAQLPIDIAAMCQELQHQAGTLSGIAQHRIIVEADPTLQVLGDADQLYSAFANLTNNAVKYTPPGGEIVIRWQADGDGAVFEVADSGIGIPAQYIPRLTERFFRVDVGRSRQSGGTGLGLAIAKHVLNLHDATLQIHSVPDQGSRFRCCFPSSRVIEVRDPQRVSVL